MGVLPSSSDLLLVLLLPSSPHLVQVRERIRINGQPISKELFSKYFWQVYNRLEETKVCAGPGRGPRGPSQ